IHGPNWHAGVIGIVASRLVDKFHLPTVLLTTIDGIAKGSARSINNFDIHSALKKCEHLLLEFGGHKHAAGLSLKIENIPAFREALDDIAHQFITEDMLVPKIEIDAELQFNELSPQFLKILNKFAPFGFINNKPYFFTRGVRSLNGVKIVGSNSIKFRAIQNNFVIDAIGPNLAHKIHLCTGGKSFSIIYNLETHNINGQKSPQISIRDIRPDE
ncbi:MAG TPA: DHHA1 domain-containing protein, partial [Candidatus Kapabacteria bacterium]|nr:DHHA1 domain-containing protein [Candidatus Kapabacteria bacterium]